MLSVINDLSLKKKGLILFLIPIISLLVVSLMAFHGLGSLNQNTSKLASSHLQAQNFLLQADRDLYQAISAERSLLFVKVNSDRYKELLVVHKENIQQARERMQKFSNAFSTPQIRELFSIYDSNRQQWESMTNKVVAERSLDTRTGRRNAIDISFGDAQASFSAMRDKVDEMTELLEKDIASMVKSNSQQAQASYGSITMTTLLALVISATLSFLIISRMTKAASSLKESMEEISQGDGDLTLRVDMNSQDELGLTSKAFNQFIDSQASIITYVQKLLAETTKTSQAVTEKMLHNNKLNDENADNTKKMVDSIQKINHSSNEMVDIANHTAEESASSKDICTNNRELMLKAGENMEALYKEMENTSNTIDDLASRTQQISSVMAVIDGIAEQTNLLALNAAIEAARAGEQGRGFAVVADEVRTLAQRTQESTQEISDIINNLITESDKAVNAMGTSIDYSKIMLEQTRESEHSLMELLNSINAIAERNQNVANAAHQQSEELGKINQLADLFQHHAEENSQSSAASLSNIEKLNQNAQELQKEVSRFKCQ